MATKQFSQETLRRFVAGKLNPEEAEEVIRYLPEDDDALTFVDGLWLAQNSWHKAVNPVTPLTTQKVELVQKKIVKRIHRSDLSANIFRMGTIGFGQVILALLRPLGHQVKQSETKTG